MTQWVKGPATKSDSQNSIPGPQWWKEKNQLSQVILWLPYLRQGLCISPLQRINAILKNSLAICSLFFLLNLWNPMCTWYSRHISSQPSTRSIAAPHQWSPYWTECRSGCGFLCLLLGPVRNSVSKLSRSLSVRWLWHFQCEIVQYLILLESMYDVIPSMLYHRRASSQHYTAGWVLWKWMTVKSLQHRAQHKQRG